MAGAPGLVRAAALTLAAALAGCGGAGRADAVRWWIADRDGGAVIGLGSELGILARVEARWPVAIQVLDGVPWVAEQALPGTRGETRYRRLSPDARVGRDWGLGPPRAEPPQGWSSAGRSAGGRPWAAALASAHPRLAAPATACEDPTGSWLLIWLGAVLLARPTAEGWRFGPSQGGFEALAAVALNDPGRGPRR